VAKLAREGVALAYEEAGSGDPPFLFVHGVACDRSCFASQVEQFRRGHRTVSVDLRGHGESDKPHQEYTISGFADDLAWLCEQLNVERPVVVGHSLGGVVAMVLAAQYPDLPTAIVMVDAPIAAIDGPPSASDPRRRMLDALKGPGYADGVRSFVDRLFLPTDDAERRARITRTMTAAPQHVFASAVEQVWSCNLTAAAAACRVPTLYIQAAGPRPELGRLGELCPQLAVGRTVGAGHFNMLEVPEQVNAMIARFLATTLPS
jgi:pimeloyl-ACP methyl ester carboxylesterase